ncbi:MAG TPA: YciI family protein [Polyangia bacterium]|nr:YciI family protein [Polyangia bacterium]
MRFIITAQPGKSGQQPPDINAPFDEALFTAHMKFNEEMYKAGVLVAAEGLNPGGRGARIEVTRGKRAVIDGPFTESKELVGGFYIVDVKSLDEAISWALRCPSGLGFDDVLEIRPLTSEADLPPKLVEMIRTAAPAWSASWDKR